MIPKFFRGYTVYNSDRNQHIAFVTPHSGPSFDNVVSRDEYSDTVASICYKKLGGNLIISNVARRRLWGIDFNRDIPSPQTAIKMYKSFVSEEKDSMFKYNRRYGWIAKDEFDYYNRLRIFQNYWAEVGKYDIIILIHRAFTRIKAVPSLIDVITFKERGVKKKEIKEIIKNINSKYFEFFRHVFTNYKKIIYFEEERVISDLLRVLNHFNPAKMPLYYKNPLEKDLEKILKYASKYSIKNLKANFNPQNFLAATKSALDRIPLPYVTIENVFQGELAFAPKRKIIPTKGKIIIEIEPSSFMSFWYPEVTADIILEIVNNLNMR